MKVFLTILIFISSTNLFSQARISSFDKYDIQIIKKLKHLKNDSILIQAGPGSFFHFKGKSIDVANFYSNGKLVGLARFNKQ